VLPPGAEAAVLFGDPSKEGLFVLRLRFPAGYRVAPHTHPVDEVVTVLSGTFCKGMGKIADRRKAQPLPAGSFFALPPNTAHYAFLEEETVIQISTVGPWDLSYINPKDDPRQKTQSDQSSAAGRPHPGHRAEMAWIEQATHDRVAW
jgi:quercetin dioxygenase-like cupin family protein